MSRQFWSEAISWAVSDGTAIATSTTETIIFPNVTIPANYMQDGRILRLTLFGRYGSTSAPTLTFRVRWNGVTGTLLAATGAMVVGTTVTSGMWKAEWLLQTRTNGATGTIFAVGNVQVGDDATTTVGSATNTPAQDLAGSAGVAVPAAVTVDLTSDMPLSVTAQWGTSSASNTLTGHIYIGESLN